MRLHLLLTAAVLTGTTAIAKDTAYVGDIEAIIGDTNDMARGVVFLDANQNSQFDDGETGIEGVLVSDVERDSEAAAAGLLPGMIITEADYQKVKSPRDIEKAVEAAKKRDKEAILLRVQTRQGFDFRALPIKS